MAKVGIFSWFSYSLPIEERLRLIKGAGFEAASLWWGDENKHLQPEMARRLGLEIDNIHAPFNCPNELWKDNLNGEGYLDMLLSCVNDCAQHGIPVAVVHITAFAEPPQVTKTGMERIRRLVCRADDKGITLAFENLNFLEHLDAVFKTSSRNILAFVMTAGMKIAIIRRPIAFPDMATC